MIQWDVHSPSHFILLIDLVIITLTAATVGVTFFIIQYVQMFELLNAAATAFSQCKIEFRQHPTSCGLL